MFLYAPLCLQYLFFMCVAVCSLDFYNYFCSIKQTAEFKIYYMKLLRKLFKRIFGWIPAGVACLAIFFLIFGYLASRMGTANMLNTIMNNAHDLLLNTVFYLMAICVITGAIGRIFMEFGVVTLLEKLLRPLMKPDFFKRSAGSA